MLCLAAIHLGRGLRVLLDTSPPYNAEMAVLHDMIPPAVHGGLWLAVGAALVILALVPGHRAWPLAVLLPTFTAASYAWSVVMWWTPGPPPGSPSALGQVIIWAAISGWAYLTAGWPESEAERREG